MKSEKRTERLEIRVSPLFLEIIQHLTQNGMYSVSDVIHNSVAQEYRVAYFPGEKNVPALDVRLDMANKIDDTDNLKRRRQIEKFRNKKKPGD